MTATTSDKGISALRLKSFIERIERIEEEKKCMSADIREVYAEAKSSGFDVKIMRKVIALRKLDDAERQEQEALIAVYVDAIGDYAGTSMGRNAVAKKRVEAADTVRADRAAGKEKAAASTKTPEPKPDEDESPDAAPPEDEPAGWDAPDDTLYAQPSVPGDVPVDEPLASVNVEKAQTDSGAESERVDQGPCSTSEGIMTANGAGAGGRSGSPATDADMTEAEAQRLANPVKPPADESFDDEAHSPESVYQRVQRLTREAQSEGKDSLDIPAFMRRQAAAPTSTTA